MQYLVAPFGEDYYFPMRMYSKDSPLNRRILESRGVYTRTAELEDAPAWAEELGLELFHKESILVMGWRGIRSNAKRWLLVGPNVYSAAEMFVNFCQATGWATVAGTHTMGDGIGIDPALVLLPDSGLLFRFSMVAGETPKGGMSIEGSEPDLTLPGSDLSDMLDYLREANKHRSGRKIFPILIGSIGYNTSKIVIAENLKLTVQGSSTDRSVPPNKF